MNDEAGISGWQLDQDSAAAYEQYLVSRFFRRWAARLVEYAGVQPGSRVLDAGCGTGIVARTVAERLEPGPVTGLDLNAGMIDEARRNDPDRQVTWRTGSIEDMPFANDSFDLVLCQQVLQFLPDYSLALGEIRRVLAPNGRAVISLLCDLDRHPSYERLATVLDRHAGEGAGDMMRSPFGGPATGTLTAALEDAGFADIDVEHDRLEVRFPGSAEYLRQEAASSPLAGSLGTLDEKRLQVLLDELETELAPFAVGEEIVFPMETRLFRAVTKGA